MNKMLTTNTSEISTKPRRLGRGLSALLGEPVEVHVPAATASDPSASMNPGVVEPKASVAPARSAASAVSTLAVPMRAAPDPAGSPTSEAQGGDRLVLVPIDAIEPNRFQPRRAFDETQLAELAASIRTAGVIQPILLRPGAQSGRYELVAGERRWRAGRLAGLAAIPAVVSRLGDEQAAEWALVENIQRADLTPMERAWAIRGLCERFGLSHAQVGERLGIDRTTAANLSRLTDLEQDIRDLLDANQLSVGHGKVLLGAPAGAIRVGLARQAATQGWSVRRLEQGIARATEASGSGAAPAVVIGEPARAKALALRELEKQLGEHLGTSVRLRASAGGKRGSIVIKFFDLDHFDGLMSKMGFVLK